MGFQDAATLVHFRELHLLPRVIFSIGAICFVGSLFVKVFILGLFGVGVIFVGCTLNFAIGVLMSIDVSLKNKSFSFAWMLFGQFILSSAITYGLLVLAYYYYRHGEMPPYFQPLPRPH
jgi:hypothetical protein